MAQTNQVARELENCDPIRDCLRMIELKNAKAEDFIPTLERLGQTMAEQAAPGDAQLPGTTIAHHQPTNPLMISALPDKTLAVERILEALDQLRL